MNQESLEMLFQYLDKLGEKIGVAGQHIWPWFLKQQYIDAFASLVLLLFTITTFLFLWYSKIKKINWDDVNEENKNFHIIILTILNSFLLLIAFITFLNAFPDIFNPEYHALLDLFDEIK